MRASVDLPQPERPTSAVDWPGLIEKETSSTAWIGAAVPEQRQPPAGIDRATRSSTSSSGLRRMRGRGGAARAGTCIDACASWRV